MLALEIVFYLTLFFLICFSFAYFLKKRFKAQLVFKIISVIRSKKPLPFFEKFAKHKTFLHYFANIGLLLGFGSIAVDYLYGRKLPMLKRIALFAFSFTIFYSLIYLLIGFNLSSQLLSSSFELVLSSFAFFGIAGFSITLLGINAVDALQKILSGEKAIAGIAPLIPGIQIPNVPIFVPLHGWLSLLIILIVHEGFHGIIARMHKIKLKSAGIILFGFLPIGAFVEPDEKKFEKEKSIKKLQVLSAGPTANIALFIIALGIFTILSITLLNPFILQEVKVSGVSEFLTVNGIKQKSPAFGKLHAGDTILELNGKKISSIEELRDASKKTNVLNFKVKDTNGIISMQKITKSPAGTIGVHFEQPYSPEMPALNALLVEFFFWLFILSFLVAVANFMPFWAFDGGRIVQILFPPYLNFLKMPKKDLEKLVARFFFWSMGILILINALPLFQF